MKNKINIICIFFASHNHHPFGKPAMIVFVVVVVVEGDWFEKKNGKRR
jgi:hypothetical protein